MDQWSIAEHRHRLCELLDRLRMAPKARDDIAAHRFGGDGLQRGAPNRVRRNPAQAQPGGQFAHEERLAARLPVNHSDGVLGRSRPGLAGQDGADPRVAERSESEKERVGPPCQGLQPSRSNPRLTAPAGRP